jgi:hypothetical protein
MAMVGAKKFLSRRSILAVGIAIAVLASALPALAQGGLTGVIVDFPDSGVIDVNDSVGNLVGQGEHSGTVRCSDGNCGQKTKLLLQVAGAPVTIEYKFKNLLALDTENLDPEITAVVAGTGVISSEYGKERFAFTATFEKNLDGSLSVTYVASRPDASFVIPQAPGAFTLVVRP